MVRLTQRRAVDLDGNATACARCMSSSDRHLQRDGTCAGTAGLATDSVRCPGVSFRLQRQRPRANRRPRPSLEERNPAGPVYEAAVQKAAENLVAEPLLLPEDAACLSAGAEN